MSRVRRGHRSRIDVVSVPWARHIVLRLPFDIESEVDESTYLCLDGLDMDVSAGFSSLEENEVDESVDHGWMVAAAASGDPIFGLVATTLGLPLHRQRLHHGWTWPRPPLLRWSLKKKPECRFQVFVRTFSGTRTFLCLQLHAHL